MNATNIKHGYSLMVRDARGANLESRGTNFKSSGRIYATSLRPTRGAILKSGAQYWGTQGLDSLTVLAPGAGPAK